MLQMKKTKKRTQKTIEKYKRDMSGTRLARVMMKMLELQKGVEEMEGEYYDYYGDDNHGY